MPPAPLYPLPFEPWLRPMPWGGRQLERWADVGLPAAPIGEAWLLSDHRLHDSRVAVGPLAGVTIRQLMSERGEELLGKPATRFPLLIKLLDARENLSIQVHPDDAGARRWAPDEGGKTEAWVVLEADPGSTIYLGLKPGVDKAMLKRELEAGTVSLCLRRYEPRPGDCYFVPPGAVHALGGGLVLLEVQQTSDATFRLHDWGRLDVQGRPRELHLEAGLACLIENPGNAGLKDAVRLDDRSECLVRCDHFELERVRTDRTIALAGPLIVIALDGEGTIAGAQVQSHWKRGSAILVPASIDDALLKPGGPCVLVIARF